MQPLATVYRSAALISSTGGAAALVTQPAFLIGGAAAILGGALMLQTSADLIFGPHKKVPLLLPVHCTLWVARKLFVYFRKGTRTTGTCCI